MEQSHFLGGGGHETVQDFPEAKDAFKFAFVRNPWDRFVSAYACQLLVKDLKDKDAFNQFIYDKFMPMEFPIYGVFWRHFLPQWYFLLDDNDRIGVDFVGRYETLHRDWEYICTKLGVAAPLSHLRRVDHMPYKDYYTFDNWSIIGRLYERDIRLFGYSHLAL